MRPRRRISGGGNRWALMARQDIPDLLDTERTYLRRLRVVQTPWFGCFLHAIRLPDSDRHLHDHPWPFASVVLRGHYVEEWASHFRWAASGTSVPRRWGPGSVHRMRRGEYHSIRVLAVPCWTLVFVGPRRSGWGYATPEGHVDHATYHRTRNPEGFPEEVLA